MCYKVVMLLGLAILLADCGSVLAQRGPGGKGGSGGGKGGGGQGFDPSQMFDRFAGGKDVWARAEITDQQQLGFFDRIAQGVGVANGQITRAQFTAGMQQLRATAGGRGPGGKAPRVMQGPGGPGQSESFDQMAERQFKQLDRNGDAYLNSDEVPSSMRAEFARWDINKDGLIDLAEFKAHLQDQMRQAQNVIPQYDPGNGTAELEEDRRPVVYSASNYPKALPAWFKQLDIDADGQVGLYEWRRSGKRLEEFQALDRNDDGFLTVEEVLYAQALVKKAGKQADTQIAADLSPGNGPAAIGFQNAEPQRVANDRGQFAGGQRQIGQRIGRAIPGDNGNGGFRKKNGRGGGKGSGGQAAGS